VTRTSPLPLSAQRSGDVFESQDGSPREDRAGEQRIRLLAPHVERGHTVRPRPPTSLGSAACEGARATPPLVPGRAPTRSVGFVEVRILALLTESGVIRPTPRRVHIPEHRPPISPGRTPTPVGLSVRETDAQFAGLRPSTRTRSAVRHRPVSEPTFPMNEETRT